MGLVMKEITNKEKNLVKGNLNGQMGLSIMENFMIIKYMGKEYIYGLIKEFLTGIGNVIKWMEKESLIGQMGENIKENIEMTKKKDMEYLNGKFRKK